MLSRRFLDAFPILSRQVKGGIGLRCNRIFKQFNRDTASSFSDDGAGEARLFTGIGDFLDTASPGIDIPGLVADLRNQWIARDGFVNLKQLLNRQLRRQFARIPEG